MEEVHRKSMGGFLSDSLENFWRNLQRNFEKPGIISKKNLRWNFRINRLRNVWVNPCINFWKNLWRKFPNKLQIDSRENLKKNPCKKSQRNLWTMSHRNRWRNFSLNSCWNSSSSWHEFLEEILGGLMASCEFFFHWYEI